MLEEIIKRAGRDSFYKVLLKIHSAGSVSEVNFSNEEIDKILLPLSQLGIISAEDIYARKDHRHFMVFRLLKPIQEIFVDYNTFVQKKAEFLSRKYSVCFFSFLLKYLLIEKKMHNKFIYFYSDYDAKEINEKLPETFSVLQDFEKNCMKHFCGFRIYGHSTSYVYSNREFYLLPELVVKLRNMIPAETGVKLLKRFKVLELINNTFSKPPTDKDWFVKFLKQVDEEGLASIWEVVANEMTKSGILINGRVVVSRKGLIDFIRRELHTIDQKLSEKTKSEELAKILIEKLEKIGRRLPQKERRNLLRKCLSEDDFENFISSLYNITHDALRIKDAYIDKIRCYFHHLRDNEQQKHFEEVYARFCEETIFHYPPSGDDWEILREKLLERAFKKISETRRM